MPLRHASFQKHSKAQAWAHPPPKLQGLCGLEKLNSESLPLSVRFHGYSRRKILMSLVLLMLGMMEERMLLQLWSERHGHWSTLIILKHISKFGATDNSDKVSYLSTTLLTACSLLKLLESSYMLPHNIGSDISITIQSLGSIVLTWSKPSRRRWLIDGEE